MEKSTLPNLAFEVHDELSLIVLKHGLLAPSVREWNGYLDAFRPISHRLEQMRILVLTDGGRPQRQQQAQLNTIVGGRTVQTAVVSSSMAVRFVISVFALLNPGIRGFASFHLDDAFDHLALKPRERAAAASIVLRLSRSVAGAREQAA
jgi:hypothetical protein